MHASCCAFAHLTCHYTLNVKNGMQADSVDDYVGYLTSVFSGPMHADDMKPVCSTY